MTGTTPDRDPLLDRLAEAWTAHDPPPTGLVERVLHTVHTGLEPTGLDELDGLDLELELLVLLERSEELAGTRAGGAALTLQLAAGDDLQLLLRVTPIGADQCRVDGWLTPDTGFTVTAVQGRRHTEAVLAAPGRFEFPTLRRGATRLVVAAVPPAGTAEGRLLGTTPFDL